MESFCVRDKILFLCTELSLLIQWFQTFNNSFFWVDKSLMLPLSLEVPVPLSRVWVFCPSLRGAKVPYLLFSPGSFSEFVELLTSMFLFCFVLTRAGAVESVWLSQTLILPLIVWLCMYNLNSWCLSSLIYKMGMMTVSMDGVAKKVKWNYEY